MVMLDEHDFIMLLVMVGVVIGRIPINMIVIMVWAWVVNHA